MIILRKFILFSLLALGSLPLRAQELFPNLLTPGFRGDSGTEYTGWNIFTEPYLGLNHGDVAAAASNPTLVQNLTSTAFLTSGFNIYSFSAATGFEIANNTSGTMGALGTVVFQFDALGTFLDYSTIKLNYSGGSISLNPTSIISESRVISGGFGGYTNRAAMQWNLTGLGITDYTISFQSLGSSTSFNSASLDTSTTNSEVVPLARTFAAGGSTANWSETANWSTGVIPSAGANVKVTAGSSLIADAANEVGQLTFSQSGSFALTGANTLTINTGITLAAAAGAVTVDAPIRGGGHLFLTAAEATTLTIQGDVSGAPAAGAFPAVGLTKEGKGTVAIVGDINFAGGVAVEAGTLRLSGNNTYGGATAVQSGRLEVAADAPAAAAGALGNASSTVTVGADPGTFGSLAPAELVIDGDHTVGRNVSLASGTNAKVLGAANTTGEAVFSGNITLASSTANSSLRADGVGDTLRFSGNISGGSAANSLVKDGAGTVIFSGSNKTYATATTVSAGTLILASGTATGNGDWSVASGAHLEVNGTLAGTGSLALGGRLTGSGTIDRAVVTSGPSATIAAGNSPDTLNFSSLSLSNSGAFEFELGTVSDLIDVSGLLTGSVAAGGIQFAFSDAGGLSTGVAYTLFNYGSQSGLDLTDFLVTSPGFIVSQWTIGSGSLQAEFSAVPEPSAGLLLVLSGLVLAQIRRRKRIS